MQSSRLLRHFSVRYLNGNNGAKIFSSAQSQSQIRNFHIRSYLLSDQNDGGHPANFAVKVPDHMEQYQGNEHAFSKSRSREQSGESIEYGQYTHEEWMAKVKQGVTGYSDETHPKQKNYEGENNDSHDKHLEHYDSSSNVSLHSAMQSMVPEPYQPKSTAPTHMNMPGGGQNMSLKYTSSELNKTHPSKNYSTDAKQGQLQDPSFQGIQGDTVQDLNHLREIPTPQGIQGQDCERFNLWLENCIQHGFVNCEDQLKDFKEGRKTLKEIFAEQEEQIRLVTHQAESSGQVGSERG